MPSWFVYFLPRSRCTSIFKLWFDFYSFDIPNQAEDEAALYRAKLISIEETEHDIPPNRIII